MQQDTFLRLKGIIGDSKATPPIPALIPVGRSSFYAGVKNGVYPKPVMLSPRVAVWRLSDIQAVIAQK